MGWVEKLRSRMKKHGKLTVNDVDEVIAAAGMDMGVAEYREYLEQKTKKAKKTRKKKKGKFKVGLSSSTIIED